MWNELHERAFFFSKRKFRSKKISCLFKVFFFFFVQLLCSFYTWSHVAFVFAGSRCTLKEEEEGWLETVRDIVLRYKRDSAYIYSKYGINCGNGRISAISLGIPHSPAFTENAGENAPRWWDRIRACGGNVSLHSPLSPGRTTALLASISLDRSEPFNLSGSRAILSRFPTDA